MNSDCGKSQPCLPPSLPPSLLENEGRASEGGSEGGRSACWPLLADNNTMGTDGGKEGRKEGGHLLLQFSRRQQMPILVRNEAMLRAPRVAASY